MRMNSTILKSALFSAALWIVAPVSVQAQTVEECYAERGKLQQWIGEQESSNEYEHAQELMERADLAAGEGDGKKCMELVKEADGAARSLGGN